MPILTYTVGLGLSFGLSLNQYLFFVYVSSVGSDKSGHNGRLTCSAAAEVTKSDMYPYRKGNKWHHTSF